MSVICYTFLRSCSHLLVHSFSFLPFFPVASPPSVGIIMADKERKRMTLRLGATLEGPTPPPAPETILERIATLCDAVVNRLMLPHDHQLGSGRRDARLLRLGPYVPRGRQPFRAPSYRFQPTPTRPTEHIATWTALTPDGSAVGWWSSHASRLHGMTSPRSRWEHRPVKSRNPFDA